MLSKSSTGQESTVQENKKIYKGYILTTVRTTVQKSTFLKDEFDHM